MALVVDATPLSPTNNSYVSVADALEYVSTRVADESVTEAWSDLDPPQQALYLVNASRALDSMCQWIGDKYSRDQGLKWPRTNAVIDGYLIDTVSFPRAVIEATVEMALWMMSNSGATSVSTNAEFDSIRVGPINVNFNEGAGLPVEDFFPDQVAILLKDYGGITQPDTPSGKLIKQVKLVRA